MKSKRIELKTREDDVDYQRKNHLNDSDLIAKSEKDSFTLDEIERIDLSQIKMQIPKPSDTHLNYKKYFGGEEDEFSDGNNHNRDESCLFKRDRTIETAFGLTKLQFQSGELTTTTAINTENKLKKTPAHIQMNTLIKLNFKKEAADEYFPEVKNQNENGEEYFCQNVIKSNYNREINDYSPQSKFTISTVNQAFSFGCLQCEDSCCKSYFTNNEAEPFDPSEYNNNQESLIKELFGNGDDLRDFDCPLDQLQISSVIISDRFEVNPKEYADYGLIVNPLQNLTTPTHPLLPAYLKDDEIYKRKLVQYLRKPKFTENKTETNKFIQNSKPRKYSDCFIDNLSQNFSVFSMKRRKVNSDKKIFEIERSFKEDSVNTDKRCSPKSFKFYEDKRIGFDSHWQKQLRHSEIDDDVETDEDQLNAAGKHILNELSEGIKTFLKNRKNVRNSNLLAN